MRVPGRRLPGHTGSRRAIPLGSPTDSGRADIGTYARSRAYKASQQPPTVFDDRMEVFSPGTLVQPVTLEDLRLRRPVHASRNPLLVRVLELFGVGLYRATDELRRPVEEGYLQRGGEGRGVQYLPGIPLLEPRTE